MKKIKTKLDLDELILIKFSLDAIIKDFTMETIVSNGKIYASLSLLRYKMEKMLSDYGHDKKE